MATPISNNGDTDGICSWSFKTDWTIAGGSLETSITYESSDSPIDSETVDAKGKPNLVLKPTSPDCGPCEITLNFTQKHEVRQVYVRSTARVYEMYFAPSPRSSNEYLCTVRCGIATRDDEVLHAPYAEPVDAHSNLSDGEQSKEKWSNDGTISPTLDDWIEVKVPDSAFLGNQHSSMPEKIDANPAIRIQEFYEATAEITDADACTSLTIRLLSLQSKGCLYVDEIYVFADPVESADSETPASQVPNSTASSLMAMLVPTLLQLSRTGNNRREDKRDSDTSETGVTDSGNIAHENQHEERIACQQNVKLQEVNEATPEPPEVQIPGEVSDIEKRNQFVAKTDVPYDRIERTLEQLVSRVSRIEDILLTFQENMLKPICSMETRLQRVEQQVEMLTKTSQSSGLLPCTRISAPEFSCDGSNYSSFYNEGDDYAACGAIELEKKDLASDKCSYPPDNMSLSVNDTQFLPSLVITAPEYCSDDEDNSDGMELPEEIPKQALSIDDALAAALAGFLSTASIQPSHYSPTVTVQAPEYKIEEKSSDGKVVSPSAQSDKSAPTTLSCESNGKEWVNDSVSNSSHTSSILFMEQVSGDFDEISGVDGQDMMDEGSTSCSSPGTSVNYPTTQTELEFGQTEYCQTAESTSVCERSEILKHIGNQTEDTSSALHEGVEDVVEGSEKEMFHDAFKPSSAATFLVDFELPILDVKFDSRETSDNKSPLEALLTDMSEFEVETSPVQPSEDEFLIGEQNNLILVEDGEPNSPLSGHILFVDCYKGRDAPSGMEEVAPQYSSYMSDEKKTCVSLI
ncbi:hypothetical protein RHMOL_Rhmol07G0069200 [Rhododendron molle]|uniref:Uncharacterized protein n=2 Tax=Rhododendron molle TaxID=49168 RepID=A0ACC0MZ36_RHOML|nr:hypothetical protein RHMOL_Rhmol07G0069200 [Rhododendron molle]KAI8545841.1 hypothetical protein RHMOL_Rhmol07G0069200 [Rhododendron molle]